MQPYICQGLSDNSISQKMPLSNIQQKDNNECSNKIWKINNRKVFYKRNQRDFFL